MGYINKGSFTLFTRFTRVNFQKKKKIFFSLNVRKRRKHKYFLTHVLVQVFYNHSTFVIHTERKDYEFGNESYQVLRVGK